MGIAKEIIPDWLHRIVGDAFGQQPSVSFSPLSPGPSIPGSTVDDGLRALCRRQPATALATWRQLMMDGSEDPEPWLLASALLRASRNWYERTTPGPFDPALFAEAVLANQQACRLDPLWPDAWYMLADWLLVAAVTEGSRRTAGTRKTYRLDDILHEYRALGLTAHCLRQASELDDGRRMGPLISSFAGMMWDSAAKEEILGRAGTRTNTARVRPFVDLLRRAGIAPDCIQRTPGDAALAQEVEALRRRTDLVVVVPPSRRFGEIAALFEARGLTADPGVGFRPDFRFEDWRARAIKNRVALVHPGSLAGQPFDWFDDARTKSIAIRVVDLDDSLHNLVGLMLWTTPPRERSGATDRVWYAG